MIRQGRFQSWMIRNSPGSSKKGVMSSTITTSRSRNSAVPPMIGQGIGTRKIADKLHLSVKTVEAHRANIMEKLNANTVADLLKIALGQGMNKAG